MYAYSRQEYNQTYQQNLTMMQFNHSYAQQQFDPNSSEMYKRKQLAEFAMVYRLEPLMTIINREVPFDAVK